MAVAHLYLCSDCGLGFGDLRVQVNGFLRYGAPLFITLGCASASDLTACCAPRLGCLHCATCAGALRTAASLRTRTWGPVLCGGATATLSDIGGGGSALLNSRLTVTRARWRFVHVNNHLPFLGGDLDFSCGNFVRQ